jgi:Tol biopolymer transport system component
MPIQQRGVAYPVRATPFNEQTSKFSPDSQLLAYSSDEAGRQEIFVESLGDGRRWQVSTNGGDEPEWRADGGELFYIAADDTLMSVDVSRQADSVSFAPPRKLFRAPPSPRRRNRYVAGRDGKRFLVITPEPESERTHMVVLNWPLMLKDGRVEK